MSLNESHKTNENAYYCAFSNSKGFGKPMKLRNEGDNLVKQFWKITLKQNSKGIKYVLQVNTIVHASKCNLT